MSNFNCVAISSLLYPVDEDNTLHDESKESFLDLIVNVESESKKMEADDASKSEDFFSSRAA